VGVRLKILLSYHYYKDVDLDALLEKKFAPHYPEVFIDSGGFSAMTQGVSINMSDYIAYIKRFAHRIRVYANLDVIGNAVATAANQARMEDAGLSPIPVFHTDEDFMWLEKYVERYPYIALGGMVPYMKQWRALMPWLIRCFKIADGKSVFHGFGCTTWNIISRVKWYSVDSSTWCSSFRFGTVALFDSRVGEWSKFQLGSVAEVKKCEHLIRWYGFDPEDFADRKRNERKKIAAISALAYIKAEEYLRKRHGEIHIPNISEPGTPVYLAQNGPHHAAASQGLNSGPRETLADPTPPTAKDSAGVSEVLNGNRLYLAEGGGAGKDSAGVSEVLNGNRLYLAEGGGQDSPGVNQVLNKQ